MPVFACLGEKDRIELVRFEQQTGKDTRNLVERLRLSVAILISSNSLDRQLASSFGEANGLAGWWRAESA